MSPKSLPRVEQMSLTEYNQTFGIEGEDWMMADQDCVEGSEQEDKESSSELDDFGIRPFSAPSAECYFMVNPFDGQPRSA